MKLTLSQAAKYLGVTRQAVYLAAYNKRINFERNGYRYYFSKDDLDLYIARKWNRDHFYSEHLISTKEAAYRLGVPIQRVYHLLREKIIKFHKNGGVILIDKAHFLTLDRLRCACHVRKKRIKA